MTALCEQTEYEECGKIMQSVVDVAPQDTSGHTVTSEFSALSPFHAALNANDLRE